MTRRNRGRKAVPGPSPLYDLEAELRARQSAPAPTPDPDAGTLFAFIRDHPGVTAKEVILHGRGAMTYSRADTLLKALLASGELRADPPGIPFHGWLRLYLASPDTDSPEAS